MRFQKTFLTLSIACILSPFWSPYVQWFRNHTTYIRADAFIWIGVILLAGLFFRYGLPSAAIRICEELGSKLNSNRVWIGALCLILLVSALRFINHFVLHEFMNSADEHSCYFLAECIRNLKLWAEPHPLSEFFEVMHLGNRDGKWFSVYPPGWPLVLAPALALKMEHWINPILAATAAAVFFAVGRRLYGFAAACLGTALTVLTPFYLLNNASYYSHTTCLLTTAVFIYSYLAWKEKNSASLVWAAVGAFAAGYGFLTRYLTTAAIVAPFLLYETANLLRPARQRLNGGRRVRWNRSHLVFLFVSFGMLSLNLYYNFLISGNGFDPPNHYSDPWERLGFRPDYTLIDAADFFIARLLYLTDWVPGIWLGAYFIFLAKEFAKGAKAALVPLGFISLAIAYTAYHSWGGNQYGPRYWFEGLPLMMLFIAGRLTALWRLGDVRTKKFIIGVTLASFLAGAYLILKQAVFFEQVTRERMELYTIASEKAVKPAIVFIKGHLGDALPMDNYDTARNYPDLNRKILYARDLGDWNHVLAKYHPDRTCYLGSYSPSLKRARLELVRPAAA